jgi:hypothetical protein
VIAGSLAFAMSTRAGDKAGVPPALTQAETARTQAATWVAQQVSSQAIVSCDPAMCDALKAHGFPPGNLRVLGTTSSYPTTSDVIVVTAAVHDLFGSSLTTNWAPAVLAAFGSGSARITVRLIAPHGTAAYRAALSADLANRKASGAALLRANQITVSDQARRQLTAGQVASRLVLAIASLAAAEPISIVGFGNAAPGSDPDIPLRYADLAEQDQSAHLTGAAYVAKLRTQLTSLPAAFRPARTQTVVLQTGDSVLRVEFSAPTPLGLLSPQQSS